MTLLVSNPIKYLEYVKTKLSGLILTHVIIKSCSYRINYPTCQDDQQYKSEIHSEIFKIWTRTKSRKYGKLIKNIISDRYSAYTWWRIQSHSYKPQYETSYMTFSRMYVFLCFFLSKSRVTRCNTFFFAPIAQRSGVRMNPFENQEWLLN